MTTRNDVLYAIRKMKLVRTATSKKYGKFNYYIQFDTVTNRWMVWQESTPFENDYRFGGMFIKAETEQEAIDYVNNLTHGHVGAVKTVIH